MPLSKARNRYRMRLTRLHAKIDKAVVQPKASEVPAKPEIDADGEPIYEE